MDRRILVLGAATTALLGALLLGVALRARTAALERRSVALPATRVTLRADGMLVVSSWGTADTPLGSLLGERSSSGAALTRLREALSGSSRSGAVDETEGLHAGPVDVAAAAGLSWEPVAWVLEVVASVPGLGDAFSLRLEGDPGPPVDRVSLDLYGPLIEATERMDPAVELVEPSEEGGPALPTDRPGLPRRPRVETATVLVVRFDSDARPPGDPGGTAFVIRASRAQVYPDEEPSRLGLELDALSGESAWIRPAPTRAMLTRVLGPDVEALAYVLYAARPLRPLLTYGDVFTVARALRDLGPAPVLLRGLARERPGR